MRTAGGQERIHHAAKSSVVRTESPLCSDGRATLRRKDATLRQAHCCDMFCRGAVLQQKCDLRFVGVFFVWSMFEVPRFMNEN